LSSFLEVAKFQTGFDPLEAFFNTMENFVEVTDVVLVGGNDAPERCVLHSRVAAGRFRFVDPLTQLTQ